MHPSGTPLDPLAPTPTALALDPVSLQTPTLTLSLLLLLEHSHGRSLSRSVQQHEIQATAAVVVLHALVQLLVSLRVAGRRGAAVWRRCGKPTAAAPAGPPVATQEEPRRPRAPIRSDPWRRRCCCCCRHWPLLPRLLLLLPPQALAPAAAAGAWP